MATLTAADDAALGRALQSGEQQGVEELFRKYGAHIHDFAARLVRDQTLADDITQMTYVRAIERSATLRNPARVRSWLYSIAVNLVREELIRDRDARHGEVPASTPTEEPDPESVALQHSIAELVRSAMASLEPRQQMALDLHVRHDLSTREVAAATGTSVAEASLILNRSRSALRNAIRSLLVARSRTHCPGLAAMVPAGIQLLSPWLRRSVDHHMRRCEVCRSRAAVLASPVELLGGIALLPLPASLAHEWLKGTRPAPPVQPAAARLAWGRRWRSPAVASGFATLLLFGGGLGGAVILHNRHPATAIRPPAHHQATPAPVVTLPVTGDTPSPSPTPSPTPPPTPSPTSAPTWGDAQAVMRSASGYHVHYGSYYVYPDGGVAGNPVTFDLQVQRNGDFQGTYSAIDGFIGQFDIRRVSGVLAVRHINTTGNFGNPNAPPDAMQFFNVTYDQANSLGDNWLPLTASAQRPAASVLTAALAPYISAGAAANTALAPPPGPFQVDAGLDIGSTEIRAGNTSVTFRANPNPFVELSTSNLTVRFDTFG